MNRRSFLKTSCGAFTCSLIPGSVLGANDRIRVALIGAGWRGIELAEQAVLVNGVELVTLCDPDQERLDIAAEKLKEFSRNESGFQLKRDFRAVLDDPEVDALLVGTPNHWHAHMSVMACAAGKDALIEKPLCHTPWEGWRMIEAAEHYGQIIAGGYQGRSDSGWLDFFDYLESNNQPLGALKQVHSLWYRLRKSIGKRKSPLPYPEKLDYQLWLGPARDESIFRNRFHYDWHWNWNTGNGEISNLGAHYMDTAMWCLGDPKGGAVRLLTAGGRFIWNDAGETPNMHFAHFDLGNQIPVSLEVRNLPLKPSGGRNGFKGIGGGTIATYEGGEFRGGRGGGKLYDNQNKVIEKFPGDAGGDHLPSFFRAIRSRKNSDLRCSLEDSVQSTLYTLLAGIGFRIGSAFDSQDMSRAIETESAEVQSLWQHLQRQMSHWDIDESQKPWRFCNSLTYNIEQQKFTDASDSAELAAAQSLHQREYRTEFPFPQDYV
ncbi:MAG: Gfo/Idh/MocA family oxidoreductase [Verrucomicrobiota bacterium]